MQHPLFLGQRLAVETRSPRSTGLRQKRDAGVHATGLDAEYAYGSIDKVGGSVRKLNMHPRLCAGIDPDMKMKQMRVDWRRYVTCLWMPQNGAIMRSSPDRHTAPFMPSLLKVVHETSALSVTALYAIEGLI